MPDSDEENSEDLLFDDPINRKSFYRGTMTGLICAITGGILIAMGNSTSLYGATLFLILPFAVGFVTVLNVSYRTAWALSLLITMTLSLSFLVFIGLEGIVCVIMAFPMLCVGALLGAGLGTIVKLFFNPDNPLSMTIIPILAGVSVFGAGTIENQFSIDIRKEIVKSTIIINASPEKIWDAMIEFDKVDGPKPLLMKLGLPIPESCSMSGTGLGAERTCQFNCGSIRERVTAWDRPHQLSFDVTEVKLPGRHWLGFLNASYTLEELEDGNTKVTRITTVTSTLRPAFYWQFFERLGTETEHDYILNSLKTKVLSNKD